MISRCHPLKMRDETDMPRHAQSLERKATILTTAMSMGDVKTLEEFGLSERTLQRWRAELATNAKLADCVARNLRLFEPPTSHERTSKHLAERIAPRVYQSLEISLDTLDANNRALRALLEQVQKAVSDPNADMVVTPDTIEAISTWVEATSAWHDKVAQTENARQLALAYIESLQEPAILELGTLDPNTEVEPLAHATN